MSDTKIDLFKTILKETKLLHELDFLLSDHVTYTSSELVGTSYEFNFIGNDREVCITLNPTYNSKSSTGVSIINRKTKEIITLADWMDIHGYRSEKDLFFWSNNQDFTDSTTKLILMLTRLFKNEKLNKILKGEDWEDVPFSWFGQR
jgi:hypothetical protein